MEFLFRSSLFMTFLRLCRPRPAWKLLWTGRQFFDTGRKCPLGYGGTKRVPEAMTSKLYVRRISLYNSSANLLNIAQMSVLWSSIVAFCMFLLFTIFYYHFVGQMPWANTNFLASRNGYMLIAFSSVVSGGTKEKLIDSTSLCSLILIKIEICGEIKLRSWS